jgi:polyphosphate kinase 2 (PPK2 family)
VAAPIPAVGRWPHHGGFNGYVSKLDRLDLSLRLSREQEEARLSAAQRRLLHLRLVLAGLLGDGTLGPPVCVVFEGWDASGKGGAIKRLVGRLDPRHVRVAQFAAPTPDEKRHHFLARFYAQLPGWGGMAVFDRSWYGRVLVERVDGFATAEQWERGYEEIVHFERSLALEGTVLVKLWLHISAEEQLRRFESRRDDPLKAWKLTADDWHNREQRHDYEKAVADMLKRTDHPLGPWDLIAAENKRYARVKVIQTVIARIEAGMRRHGIEPPPSVGADFDPLT